MGRRKRRARRLGSSRGSNGIKRSYASRASLSGVQIAQFECHFDGRKQECESAKVQVGPSRIRPARTSSFEPWPKLLHIGPTQTHTQTHTHCAGARSKSQEPIRTTQRSNDRTVPNARKVSHLLCSARNRNQQKPEAEAELSGACFRLGRALGEGRELVIGSERDQTSMPNANNRAQSSPIEHKPSQANSTTRQDKTRPDQTTQDNTTQHNTTQRNTRQRNSLWAWSLATLASARVCSEFAASLCEFVRVSASSQEFRSRAMMMNCTSGGDDAS